MDGMDILYLLVPLSVVLVFVIGAVFWWSLRNGQFEDLEGEGFRILMDDDKPAPPIVTTDTTTESRTIDPDQPQS
jgi:cbb3-type cytochrome oxidase maturation protein